MDFSDSPEQAAWRAKVRGFLDEHWHGEPPVPDLMADQAAAFFSHPPNEEWQQTLREHGWANPTWPKEYGGMGLSVMEQFIMREEFTEVGAPIPASA